MCSSQLRTGVLSSLFVACLLLCTAVRASDHQPDHRQRADGSGAAEVGCMGGCSDLGDSPAEHAMAAMPMLCPCLKPWPALPTLSRAGLAASIC